MPHFVSNADLVREIVACKATNEVSPALAQMLYLMVERFARRPNWRNYSFVEDMKAEALLQLIKTNNPGHRADPRPNILKFDLSYAERSGKQQNPFSYATQIISNAFRRYVKIEGALGDFRDNMAIANGFSPSIARQIADEMNRSAEPIPKRVKLVTRSRSATLACATRSRTIEAG